MGSNGLRVLVIDDNEELRRLVRAMLETAGYEVNEAADGKAGVARYRERRSHVVITDILMPEQEGLETIQILRKVDPDVRIIAMSGAQVGDGPTGYLKLAAAFGARHVLEKPFSKADRLAAVINILTER